MKQVAVLMLATLVNLAGWSQTPIDPVLMTVAGYQVTRAEFEYSLNKNYESPSQVTEQEIRDYVDLFINYRLKVQAAKDAQLDTLASFRNEFRTYRDMQLKAFVYDSLYADSIAHVVYETLKTSVGDSDIVKVSHIFLYVPQNSNIDFVNKQKERIDSIYAVIQTIQTANGGILNAEDFAELARKYSEDGSTAQEGGELPWIGPAQVIPEFRDAAWGLRPGQYCKPILSAAGYHIIYMHQRKQLEPFAEKCQEIIEQLNKRGLREDAAEHMIERMVSESGGTMTREDVMQKVQRKAVAEKPELQYLIGEYYDGLLLYEASNRMVWDKAAHDEAGLEAYYHANKSKYKWDSPHFRGYTWRAKSKEMAARLKKILKNCSADEGLELLKQQLPEDSLKAVRVHFGVWQRGENSLVDYLKFKTGKEPTPNKVLPYYGVIGKVLKQPKELIDVRAQVVSDYQAMREADWIKGLRSRYDYTVDEDVVATVNKH
ncbi:MAG: peptidylprolyl isomerase [Bacteroidaceae bacterium]|nr:peptidylprolyl isomerase [Bacteroidaceae bacterium]